MHVHTLYGGLAAVATIEAHNIPSGCALEYAYVMEICATKRNVWIYVNMSQRDVSDYVGGALELMSPLFFPSCLSGSPAIIYSFPDI